MRIKEIASVRVRYGYKRIHFFYSEKVGILTISGSTGYTARRG